MGDLLEQEYTYKDLLNINYYANFDLFKLAIKTNLLSDQSSEENLNLYNFSSNFYFAEIVKKEHKNDFLRSDIKILYQQTYNLLYGFYFRDNIYEFNTDKSANYRKIRPKIGIATNYKLSNSEAKLEFDKNQILIGYNSENTLNTNLYYYTNIKLFKLETSYSFNLIPNLLNLKTDFNYQNTSGSKLNFYNWLEDNSESSFLNKLTFGIGFELNIKNKAAPDIAISNLNNTNKQIWLNQQYINNELKLLEFTIENKLDADAFIIELYQDNKVLVKETPQINEKEKKLIQLYILINEINPKNNNFELDISSQDGVTLYQIPITIDILDENKWNGNTSDLINLSKVKSDNLEKIVLKNNEQSNVLVNNESKLSKIYYSILKDISYKADEITELDFLKYPDETLATKNGDCEDLVSLYLSTLNKLGIEAKILDIDAAEGSEGHVMVLFDTGIRAEAIEKQALNENQVFIFRNRYREFTIWKAIETMENGNNFDELLTLSAKKVAQLRNSESINYKILE